MFGEFHISKEDYNQERVKHQYYIEKKDFEIQIPINKYIEESTLEDLKIRGHWYQALEKGKIKPITNSQYLFIKALNENYSNGQSCGQIGRNWFYYKRVFDSCGELFIILNKSNSYELETLSKIIKIEEKSPEQIISKLQSLGSNLTEILDSLSYREILIKVKKKLKLECGNITNKEIERLISIKVFEERISKLSHKDKKKLELEIIKMAEKEGEYSFKPGAVFAAITAANLSGFGVYTLATTTLGTLSGIIGVTLPFAAYTSLTSAISFMTGPAGWVGAGIFALWKLTDVKYNKLIPAIIYIHWLREKYEKN